MPDHAIQRYVIIERYLIPITLYAFCIICLLLSGFSLATIRWFGLIGSLIIGTMLQSQIYGLLAGYWNRWIRIERETNLETMVVRGVLYFAILMPSFGLFSDIFSLGVWRVLIILVPPCLFCGYLWALTNAQILRILKYFKSARVEL